MITVVTYDSVLSQEVTYLINMFKHLHVLHIVRPFILVKTNISLHITLILCFAFLFLIFSYFPLSYFLTHLIDLFY